MTGITPKLKLLAETTHFSLRDLRDAKIHGHLTDHGVEHYARVASSLGIHIYTVSELLSSSLFPASTNYYASSRDKFLLTQIEYHGCPK